MADLWGVLSSGTEHTILSPGKPVTVLPVVPAVYPYLASAGQFVEASAAAGAITINLPAPGVPGDRLTVKKVDATANVITVNGNGLLIDGLATQSLAVQWARYTLVRGTANWFIE